MKLRTAFRAGVWLRRLRASNADIRAAVADAAAEALRNEVERTAGVAYSGADGDIGEVRREEGTPSFAVAFATPRIGGQVIGDTNTFVGSATGPRYNVTANGIMYAAGAGETYLPGNSAGATSTGGQYV